jgi:hypothetical protein
MCKTAISEQRPHYRDYVTSLINDHIDRAIYVDIHGTGNNVLSYFQKEFDKLPRCFIISSGVNHYDQLPPICQSHYKHHKLIIPILSSAGTPIEMLNYDLIGTLYDYTSNGPVRSRPEYQIKHVEPYHNCMKKLVEKIIPITDIKHIKHLDLNDIFNGSYSSILNTSPVISCFAVHQTSHCPIKK